MDTGNVKRLSTFKRSETPPAMRLTPRDGWILEAIHQHEGFLSEEQIGRLFFDGVSERTLRERLKLLYQNEFVERPDEVWRRQLPTMIYWLGKRGAEHIASLEGVMPSPKLTQPPPRSLIPHNLELNNVRIALKKSLLPDMLIERWVSAREFWRQTDVVIFPVANGQTLRRVVRPDGYCQLTYNRTRYRYLIELDRGSEDVGRFIREKVQPGIAYMSSDVYAARFGFKMGRYLVVTKSTKHARNLHRAAAVFNPEDKGFYFTTYEEATTQNPWIDPIWLWTGSKETGALFGDREFELKK